MAKSNINEISSPFGDKWAFAQSTDRTAPRLMRIRENLDPQLLELTLPHLMRVTWSMQDKTEMGLPSEKETNELANYENELVPRVEIGETCVLVAVLTQDSYRHWYFYLNNPEAFSRGLHNVPQKNERYPIELTLHKNENWKLFRELIASCKK